MENLWKIFSMWDYSVDFGIVYLGHLKSNEDTAYAVKTPSKQYYEVKF